MSASFKPNQAGFKALAVGPEIQAVVKAIAEKGKTIAEGLSQDFRETGDYADSFEITTTTVDIGTRYGPSRRAAAVLANTSPHAAAVEWGNEHAHRNHRVLGRTLTALKSAE